MYEYSLLLDGTPLNQDQEYEAFLMFGILHASPTSSGCYMGHLPIHYAATLEKNGYLHVDLSFPGGGTVTLTAEMP